MKFGDQVPFLNSSGIRDSVFFKSYGSRVDISVTEACARYMAAFNAVECGFLSGFHYDEDLVNGGNVSWNIVGLFKKSDAVGLSTIGLSGCTTCQIAGQLVKKPFTLLFLGQCTTHDCTAPLQGS